MILPLKRVMQSVPQEYREPAIYINQYDNVSVKLYFQSSLQQAFESPGAKQK